MSKYIIDVGDAYTHYICGEGDMLCLPVRINEFEDNWLNTNIPLTPYTEPDTEKVREEAYAQGYSKGFTNAKVQCNIQAEKDLREVGERHYQKGLSDAWEAARKILFNPDDGGMSAVDVNEVFGENSWTVMKDFSASEVVAKIKEYEDSKHKIKVGDEVECDDERYVVLQKYLNNIDELMVVLFNRRNGEINKWHLYNANGVIFKKTGKHFPEIVAALAKMKES